MNFPKGENVVIPANDYKAISATARGALWDAKNADIPTIIMDLDALKTRLWVKLTNPPADPEDRLLSMKEVALKLGVKESLCYEMARNGTLKAVKIGKYVRIPESALQSYRRTLLKGA